MIFMNILYWNFILLALLGAKLLITIFIRISFFFYFLKFWYSDPCFQGAILSILCIQPMKIFVNWKFISKLAETKWYVGSSKTSSYTASLSSMLTVQQLQPNDIEWLKNNNLKVSIKEKKLESWLWQFVYKGILGRCA